MKNKSREFWLFVVLISISASFTFLPVEHYVVSAGYKMEFKSSDPSGSFSKMGGDIYFSDADLVNSKFNLNIEVSSINTGNGMQNKKAQTAEWFNAASFPQIKFKSSKVAKNGNGYLITGDLTMKGTTKQITIPATKTITGNKIVFSGTFNVDRLAFKVGKKSAVVPDKMKVVYVIPALKK
jgi:polyisoprenoid-binding protein YceI